jgi:flagellar basal body rod protein FlgB
MSVLDSTQLILQRAISGATLRGTVLSDNLANADTPGFQPSDVDFHAALQGAIDGGPGAVERISFAPEQGPAQALRADGNGVDPEAESAKLAERPPGSARAALARAVASQERLSARLAGCLAATRTELERVGRDAAASYAGPPTPTLERTA